MAEETWRNFAAREDRRILALFTNALDDHNVWVYVGGLGWRKLAGDYAEVNILTTMCTHAKSDNRRVDFTEVFSDDRWNIYRIYVF